MGLRVRNPTRRSRQGADSRAPARRSRRPAFPSFRAGSFPLECRQAVRDDDCVPPRSTQSPSLTSERRLALGQKRFVTDAEIFRIEAVVALVVFRVDERARIGKTAREFLVPTRGERRAIRDAL